MSKLFEKILKYNPGEKLLKAPFAIYLDLEGLLKREQSRRTISKMIISKNHTQKKKSGMSLLAGRCLQNVHLIKQKINSTITEEKIALKNSLKS